MQDHNLAPAYICHDRKSNLVEFQMLPAESSIGVSTNINLVESSIGFSASRKSSLGDLGMPWGPKSNKLGR